MSPGIESIIRLFELIVMGFGGWRLGEMFCDQVQIWWSRRHPKPSPVYHLRIMAPDKSGIEQHYEFPSEDARQSFVDGYREGAEQYLMGEIRAGRATPDTFLDWG